jgi:nucleoside-diphosphate-sugar epimerase
VANHVDHPTIATTGLLPEQAVTTFDGEPTALGRRERIVITGAAGLVGQTLTLRLKQRGYTNLVAIDKHPNNVRILRELNPDIEIFDADLGGQRWQPALAAADALVVAHAQIGGVEAGAYRANNIAATDRLLAAAKAAEIPYVVHISSSVVNSAAVDFYTETKKEQERIARDSGLPAVILRPTLMFGWFDRKHLGWLARFMTRTPVFPIPGSGRYLRQPLYAGDFCNIIIACLDGRLEGAYNISGLERIDFIDLVKLLRDTLGRRTPIVKVPYSLFRGILQAYALVDKDPPFTTMQLEALATPDVFEVIDWPEVFGVKATPLAEALRETFLDPRYSNVRLEF